MLNEKQKNEFLLFYLVYLVLQRFDTVILTIYVVNKFKYKKILPGLRNEDNYI